jgi:predicted RNA-binding protein
MNPLIFHNGSYCGFAPAFDYCNFINEDYKLMGEFFDRVYRHTQGEDVVLEDIEVY